MAIDSRDKRASAGNLPWLVAAPLPDGAIDSEADRRHYGGLYRGLTGAPAPSGAAYAPRRRSAVLFLYTIFDEDED